MMELIVANPRSALHALPPIGLGTSEVESLSSYFCRLAGSHGASTFTLSRNIAAQFDVELDGKFEWHHRHFSGLCESAFTWSSALSAMTGVGQLDRLTFLPWQSVIARNGLRIVSKGQFCPACFEEDCAEGRTPYFRLAWEASEVSICHRHRRPLTTICSTCQRDNVRHAAACVVPGWCTHCGHFLGQAASEEYLAGACLEPDAPWKARQVGMLVEAQQALTNVPSHDALIQGIIELITKMDQGQCAAFGSRIGIAKSTIHHWLKKGGVPTLGASMRIAVHCGISLPDLLTGNLAEWNRPGPEQQLALKLIFPAPAHRAPPRSIEWESIRLKLRELLVQPEPICVLEAARGLGVEARQLYLNANKETRALGERWKAYSATRPQIHIDAAMPRLEAACLEIWSEGRAVTRREIADRVPAKLMGLISNHFGLIREVQARLRLENGHTFCAKY